MNAKILLVDDDPGAIQVIAKMLAGMGQLSFATSGEEALRAARDSVPDLILLDAEMPGMSGFQVCEKLKAEPDLASVPVIFVTSHCDSAFEVAGFEAGAADFIAKPVSAPLVLARVKAQLCAKRTADALRGLSTIDALTGVANRRRFDATLEREWLRSQRAGDPLALLLIDLDHFTLFNERYGQARGNACLCGVADVLLSACLRPADFVARYSGQEFALVLPQTPRYGAERVSHRVLDAVEALGIPHDASLAARHVTVSIGIGCFDDASADWKKPPAATFGVAELDKRCSDGMLLQAANNALLSAKHAGRAQARLLDASNANAPNLVRDITPSSRERRLPEPAGT
jgi:diguanylate cyclase (GGDEF)-like protein